MMKIGYGRRIAGSVFLLTILLTAGGCGYKTEPVPPESVVPLPINDLRYTIDESGVHLTWSYPVKTVKGTEIVDISSFEVYRAVVPLAEYCDTCPIPFGEPQEVSGGVTIVDGKRRIAEYRTALLRSGHKYFFKVRSRTSWWADSADSNIVSFVWHVPTSAPQGLKTVADDSQITISWKPVTTLIDGRKVDAPISYQLLKSEGGKEFKPFGKPVRDEHIVDTLVVNGHKYFYKVQSQLEFAGSWVDGGMSNVVSAVPVDKTPPLPPTGVTAVQTETGIKVFWDRTDNPEVKAYRVYRRLAKEQTFRFLGEVSADFTLFVDNNVPENEQVYYAVTAIDKAQKPNESAKSREATIR